MPGRKEAERLLAIQLRAEGLCVAEIAQRLTVSKASVSTWVRHVSLTDKQKDAIKKRAAAPILLGQRAACEANRLKYSSIREQARRQGYDEALGDPIHVAGCMLYWAEGSKRINSAVLVNTDAQLVLMFVKFLIFMGVPVEKISVGVNVHATPGNATARGCQLYWSKLLSIPSARVRVGISKDVRGDRERKSRYAYGIARIEVCDVSVVQRIYGGIERYAGATLPFGRK